MIRFTDSAYRQYFYRHWDWMAETGSKSKGSFAPFQELRKLYKCLDQQLSTALADNCFACGASIGSCEVGCPISSGNCSSNYGEWCNSEAKQDRQKYARQIAQLPWRGKSREEWEKEDGIR
jgi:hypothetical protein